MGEYDNLTTFEVHGLIEAYGKQLSVMPRFLSEYHVKALAKLLDRLNELRAEEERRRAA